jgi:hypothetical protein
MSAPMKAYLQDIGVSQLPLCTTHFRESARDACPKANGYNPPASLSLEIKKQQNENDGS